MSMIDVRALLQQLMQDPAAASAVRRTNPGMRAMASHGDRHRNRDRQSRAAARLQRNRRGVTRRK